MFDHKTLKTEIHYLNFALVIQVQIRVKTARQPLTENLFKPIIQDNYFTSVRFWFELDHSQTSRLLCLFSSQPVCASLLTTNCSFVSKKVENELKEKKLCMTFSGLTVNSDSSDEYLGTTGKDAKEPAYTRSKEPAVNCKFWDPPIVSEDVAAHINVDPHSADREAMTLETSTSSTVEDPIIAQVSSIYKFFS